MEKQQEEALVEAMWKYGYRFVACWNLNQRSLTKLMAGNGKVLIEGGEEVKVQEVIKMVIQSKHIKNYVIVVLPPEQVMESFGPDDDLVYTFHHKAQQLMRLFNLAPARAKMTMPKPFSDYRKNVVKMVETLEEVLQMVRLG